VIGVHGRSRHTTAVMMVTACRFILLCSLQPLYLESMHLYVRSRNHQCRISKLK